jgi:PHS family inorganic phosphate transporter-like MFS transporter
MFLGLIVTLLWVPESKGMDLDEFEEDYIPPVTHAAATDNDVISVTESVPVSSYK